MRCVARFFVRLYPASWRERYGEEFEALIEDSPPGWRATFDVVKGAVRMRLQTPAFPKLAAILSLLGLVAGFSASWLSTPMFVSQTELQMRPANIEHLIAMQRQVLSRTSLSQIIQEPRIDLYGSERARLPLEDVIERMRTREINIRIMAHDKNSMRFRISFLYPDPEKARKTVQSLVARFSDANLEQGAGANLDVVAAPDLPVQSAAPNRAIFAAVGFGAGFVLAVVIALFRRTPPPVPFPAQTA